MNLIDEFKSNLKEYCMTFFSVYWIVYGLPTCLNGSDELIIFGLLLTFIWFFLIVPKVIKFLLLKFSPEE